ncbi:MAG TPA: cytochrome b562 [Opitutaceae bacterium]|nr:cytochrome b562 [Opitutaceae bacterium]
MKKVIFPLIALALISPFSFAQDKPKGDKKETQLESSMDKLSSAFRKLRRQITDPSKNENSLELVASIRAAAEESTKLEPAKAADIPADKRAAFVAEYKKQMQEFLVQVDALEAALKAKNNTSADEIVKKLAASQKAGHKEFKREE